MGLEPRALNPRPGLVPSTLELLNLSWLPSGNLNAWFKVPQTPFVQTWTLHCPLDMPPLSSHLGDNPHIQLPSLLISKSLSFAPHPSQAILLLLLLAALPRSRLTIGHSPDWTILMASSSAPSALPPSSE